MCPIYDVLSHFMMFCCKIVIYAVLSRYLFCRDLRAFAWRKIQPRITPRGEKMTNIRSGLVWSGLEGFRAVGNNQTLNFGLDWIGWDGYL